MRDATPQPPAEDSNPLLATTNVLADATHQPLVEVPTPLLSTRDVIAADAPKI